jgi:hypothetical protein
MAMRGVGNTGGVVIGIKSVKKSHFRGRGGGGRKGTRASPCNVDAALERRWMSVFYLYLLDHYLYSAKSK